MSNLLPPSSQKRARAHMRARLLLASGLALFSCALLFALALAPAEAALLTNQPPTPKAPPSSSTITQDATALGHTKALLGDLKTINATSSLDAVVAALSEAGTGIQITGITYTVANQSISLSGRAKTPDEVNTFREALQSDLRFTNVSVPVSALLGSQNGTFTITMNIAQ